MQGGYPGYEGAKASAFNSDGSLKSSWMDRLKRVIEGANKKGLVVIVSYFYQRQDEYLKDDDAVKNAVKNATDWLVNNDYKNVIIEIANEYKHGGFGKDSDGNKINIEILSSTNGIKTLINLDALD